MPHATPVSLRLRAATASNADVAVIRKLVMSAYRGEESRAGWTTEADLLDDERIDEAGIRAKIETPKSVILMAYDDNGVLAACCEVLGRSDGETAYFGLFAVDPLRQAGGIGRQVLAAAEDHARRTLGAKYMEMNVIWSREDLMAWYVRRGYVVTDRTSPFPYDGLVNGKALRDDLHFKVLTKEL